MGLAGASEPGDGHTRPRPGEVDRRGYSKLWPGVILSNLVEGMGPVGGHQRIQRQRVFKSFESPGLNSVQQTEVGNLTKHVCLPCVPSCSSPSCPVQSMTEQQRGR